MQSQGKQGVHPHTKEHLRNSTRYSKYIGLKFSEVAFLNKHNRQ